MNAMILECANHFETRSIADMCKTRIFVSSEMTLQNASIPCAIKDSSPCLKLAYTVGGLLCVDLNHSPLIDILSATHCIGKVNPPVIAVVHVSEGSGYAAFGHDRVGFTEQRLTHKTNRNS